MIDLSEDGYVDLAIDGVTNRVDLFRTNNDLMELHQQCQRDEKSLTELHEVVAEYIQSLGYTKPSHRVVVKFQIAITSAVENLRKNDGGEPTPGSPDSTEPV